MIRLTELLHRCRLILIDTADGLLTETLTLLYQHRKKVWKAWNDARTVVDIVTLVR